LLAEGRGLLSAPEDASGLARHIGNVLSAPELGRVMAGRSLQEVQNRYGVETMVQAYESLYRQAIAVTSK